MNEHAPRAKFRSMDEGTAEDWATIGSHFFPFAKELPDRVLAHLKLLDPSIPILERLKFMAIFSSIVDEFFMIRVSGIKEQVEEVSREWRVEVARRLEFRHAVAGTFDEMAARHGGKAQQRLHVQQQRPFDEAMHHQPVLRRIDRRHAGMVAFEEQAIRRGAAEQALQGREGHRGLRSLGQAGALVDRARHVLKR